MARAGVVAALLLAGAASPTVAQTPVVPAGKEPLLADMLGRGAALPDGCALVAGQVDRSVITGTYDCRGEAVVVELRHAGSAAAAALRTDKFDVVVLRGAPPETLLSALQARVRAGEESFEWVVPASRVIPQPSDAPPPWVGFGEVFFALLIVGVVASLWRVRHRLLTADALWPLGLAVLGLVLRCLAHGGPADIRAVLGDLRTSRGGWVAFTTLVFEFLPPVDETIWTLNRIAGAASVPLLYAAMRARFSDRLAAVGAAATLAVTPLLVRFSASDAPYIVLCAAFLGAIVAYDRFCETRSVGACALAAGLLTAAMQLRPEGPWLAIPAVLIAAARPLPEWSTLRRPAIVACAVLFAVANLVPTVVAVTGHAEGGYAQMFVLVGSLMGSPWMVAPMTPRPLAALVILGGMAALLWRRPGMLWLVATLIADPIDFTADTLHGHFANARYHIPAMYLACGLAGLGVAAAVRGLARLVPRAAPLAPAIAVGVIIIAAAPGFDLLQRQWTPQREFEFFREGVRQLDDTCRVVTLAQTRDAGFAPFDYLVPGRLLDISEFLESPRGTCFVYYRCGNCYASSLDPAAHFTIHPACRAIEEQFELEPIIEREIPALPYRGETYGRDPLPLGFYRIRIPPAGGR